MMRDIFTGKKVAEIQSLENISENLSNFYRQKCRAAGISLLLLNMN